MKKLIIPVFLVCSRWHVFNEPATYKIVSPPFVQYDHAGKNETLWMMYYRPANTDQSLIRANDYVFCWRNGKEAIRHPLHGAKPCQRIQLMR